MLVWQSPHNPSNTANGVYLWSNTYIDEEVMGMPPDVLGSPAPALEPQDPPQFGWLLGYEDVMAAIFGEAEEEAILLADSPQ